MLRITLLLFALLVSWTACAQAPSKVRSPSPYEDEFSNEIWNRSGVQIAQVPLTGAGKGAPGGGAYQGPGDIVSGAVAWWSWFSCYSAAFSGSIADYTDSATGNTTGTRLQCGPGGVVTALVSGSACTFVTGNACSPLATTCATACNISTVYNQSGTTSCTGTTCDILQTTNASRPTVNTTALNGHPCGSDPGTIAFQLQSANSLTLAQPYTIVSIAERNGAFTSNGRVIGVNGGGISFGFRNTVNTFGMNAGTIITATASDSAFHAFIGVANGASSSVSVDGSTTSGPGGATSIGANLTMFNDGSGTPLTGIACEGGIWPSAFSAGQITSMNANMHTRWNF